MPDLHLVNARIWTGDPDRPTAGSITIRDGRIVALDGIQSARRAFLPAELALLARVAGLRVRRVGPLGPAYLALHAVGGGRGDELP